MSSNLTPLRWPAEWTSPSALDLVKGSPVNCLLIDKARFAPIAEQAAKAGLQVLDADKAPADVTMISGEWPGVRMGQQRDQGSAGPTGNPWIDSNGWQIRLARERNPKQPVWVNTEKPKEGTIMSVQRHLLGVADAGAYGGRWVVDPDREMAAGLAAGKPDAIESWKRIMGALAFFGTHAAWASLPSKAVVGVLSDYAGNNEFLAGEILNLTARLNQPYKILLKGKITDAQLRGLRQLIYADDEAPAAPVRQAVMSFVQTGGLLVTGPKWGEVSGRPAPEDTHPRFKVSQVGKGRVAVGTDFSDPYWIAGDAQILLSHRYDLVRFWNGGSLLAYPTSEPAGGSVMHLNNYATFSMRRRGGGGAFGDVAISAFARGSYRSARLWLLGENEPKKLETVPQPGGLELHLPVIPVYAAVELSA